MKLSIITVNKNNASGLNLTIKSVVEQTFSDFEYLVIDGGSSDNSTDIIRKYENKISFWVSEPDNGIFNAMNKGIQRANGEYLLFLNSGDWFVDERVLEKVFKETRSADIIYGHTNFVSNRKITLRKADYEHKFTLSYFFGNSICHPSSFISRRLLALDLYDESYRISADKKFFMENIIFRNCSLQRIDEVIVNFNTDGISYSQVNKNLIRLENEKILKQLLPARVLEDIEFYKNSYIDLLALAKIKRFKLLHFGLRCLKKVATICQKLVGNR